MWLQKWIWERYKELRLKIGINTDFTFQKAKEILRYDSNQTIYKLLNELEKLKIIVISRLKKDARTKLYRIIIDLKDLPYSNITIPTNSKPEPNLGFTAGSMAVYGATYGKPSKSFEKIYQKEGKQQITLELVKPATTIEDFLIQNLREFKSPESILKIIKNYKIDFNKVITNLNSFQRRYFGALLEILKKDKEIIDKLYELTKKDNRKFSIFPRKVKKIPKEYRRTAKRWRINLNVDVVDIDEL